MATVNLYGLERSVYTRIARLALEEKAIAYALNEVEIFGPQGVPPEHFGRHPFGRIPALEHRGFWLYETNAITRYVDEAFVGPVLQPEDPKLRARLNQVVGLLDSYAYRPMVWGVFVERVRKARNGTPPDEAKIAASMAAARTCVEALAAIVTCKPYLLTGTISLADIHAYPILRCFALAPEGAALLAEHESLQRWMAKIAARPSAVRTRSRYELEA